MPRPDSIAAIHAARYDLDEEKGKGRGGRYRSLLRVYEQKIEAACKEFGCAKEALLDTIAADFREWRKKNGLPLIVPATEEPKKSQLKIFSSGAKRACTHSTFRQKKGNEFAKFA